MERKIDEYIKEYVPDYGWAPTLGGELLRAVQRIEYRFFNDGEYFSRWSGRETCGSSALFIALLCRNYESYGGEKSGVINIIENLNSIPYEEAYDKKFMENKYKESLYRLEECIVKFLELYPEVLKRESSEYNDSRKIFKEQAKYAWGDWDKGEKYSDGTIEDEPDNIDEMPELEDVLNECSDKGIS